MVRPAASPAFLPISSPAAPKPVASPQLARAIEPELPPPAPKSAPAFGAAAPAGTLKAGLLSNPDAMRAGAGHAPSIRELPGRVTREQWGPQKEQDLAKHTPLGTVDSLVIHETQWDPKRVPTDGRNTLQQLEYEHSTAPHGPKFSDIGYHHVIGADECGQQRHHQGRVEIIGPDGKPQMARGAHAYDQNLGKLGVVIDADNRGLNDMTAKDRAAALAKDPSWPLEGPPVDSRQVQLLDDVVGAAVNEHPKLTNLFTHNELITRNRKTGELVCGHTDCSCGKGSRAVAQQLRAKYGLQNPHRVVTPEERALLERYGRGELSTYGEIMGARQIQREIAQTYVEQLGPLGRGELGADGKPLRSGAYNVKDPYSPRADDDLTGRSVVPMEYLWPLPDGPAR